MRKLIPFMMSLALVTACSDDDDPVVPAGSIGVSTTQTSATLAAGGTTTIPITVSRTNFTGAINLTAENLPTGVTASFAPASVPNNSTTSTLTLTAAANAPASPAGPITIRASGSGVTSVPTAVPLTVTAATAGINLVLGTTTASITQGATVAIPVSLTRLGTFAGTVNLAVDGLPTGVTATITPSPIAANSTIGTVLLTANGTAATGTQNVTIRGTGTGIDEASQVVELTVNPSTTSGLSFTPAPAALVIQRGQTAQTTVTVARTGGFTGDVTMVLENAPEGMTATVNPTTITGNTATVTIATTAAMTSGVYQVRLRGTSGTTNGTAFLTVIVTN